MQIHVILLLASLFHVFAVLGQQEPSLPLPTQPLQNKSANTIISPADAQPSAVSHDTANHTAEPSTHENNETSSGTASARDEDLGPSVLALTAMNGWRHDSVTNATHLFKLFAEHRNWQLTISSNPNEHFNSSESLGNFDVIVFLLTIGPIFNDVHKASFYSYVNEGGAIVGVHSAVDTNKDWLFFTNLWAAEFIGHPPVQRGTMRTIDPTHATTSFLPATWEIEEEFYNYAPSLNVDEMHVLLTVDEESYEGGIHGEVHPISWTRSYMPVGSRIWVTTLGHSPESYSVHEISARPFQIHLALGVEWAANGTARARQRAVEMRADLMN